MDGGAAAPAWRAALEEDLRRRLSGFAEVRVEVLGPVAGGRRLGTAHRFASRRDIASYETPAGLPRRRPDARTRRGLVQVTAECDTGAYRDARNEWYAYRGYFLSLLVVAASGEVWDARWERADY